MDKVETPSQPKKEEGFSLSGFMNSFLGFGETPEPKREVAKPETPS